MSVIFILMFMYLVWYVLTTGELMFYARQAFGSDHIATYQGFARSGLTMSIFLFAFSRNPFVKIMVFCSSAFVLFIMGSRSEFVAFLFCIGTFVILRAHWGSLISIFLYSVLMMGAVVVFLAVDISTLQGSRQFQLFNLGNASSFISRLELQNVAVAQILMNPILGEFGGHIIANGSAGSYSHNVLSVWVNYGLMVFVVYLALIVFPLVHTSLILLKNKHLNVDLTLAFLFLSAVFLLVVTSKSVFWVLPPLAWGLYARAIRLSKGHRGRPTRRVSCYSAVGEPA
jgi:hypothetical protein